MVRGKKNFLPPTQLEMGMAVLFRLGDDDSIARHRNERRDFALMELEQNDEETVEDNKEDHRPHQKIPDLVENVNPVHEDTMGESNHTKNERVRDDDSKLPDTSNMEGTTPTLMSDSDQVDEHQCSIDKPVLNEKEDADKSTEELTEDNVPKKRGLSVRDRKLIKKYGSLEAAQANAEWKANVTDEDDENDVESTLGASVVSQTLKRGKKAKIKKLAKKYADQDEEEREWAMLALQGGEKHKKSDRRPQTTVTETQQKAAADTAAFLVKDSRKVAEGLPISVQEILIKCLSNDIADSESLSTFTGWSKFDADTLEQLVALKEEAAQLAVSGRLFALAQQAVVQNFSSSLAGILRTVRKYGYENLEKQSQETADDSTRKPKSASGPGVASWKQTLAEEGLDDEEVDDDAVDDTVEISKLTGKPQPEDTILYAVPVCAPYSTLAQYAYRVKLTPGNLKRGKAAKQCVEMLLKIDGDKSATIDRYRDLIKKVGDNDWVQAICSDVKISAPGASKVAKNNKTSTKKQSVQNKKKK